ncbi:MAG: hypothetical protein WDN28_30855 [Chthoniobacter sp.]
MTTDGLTLGLVAAVLALGVWLALRGSASNPVVVKLAGLKWTRADFCRGWLITGDTGSGKTRSGITPLLYQIFQNEPGWGGLCIDDKGLYWETLCEMARHFGREHDLILLQVRPDDAPSSWQPRHTYSLTSDRSIPYNTFAKAVVDTASSLGQAGDKGFFRNQAQTHIAAALETLREIGADVTLENAYHLLLDQSDLDEAMTDLASSQQTARRRELVAHFTNRFLSQPPEQIGGVKETIANYLQAFVTPDIAQVFCPAANTFDFEEIDRGKIICVAMPQKFQTERRYVNTFLKMLFYTHALRRFDKSKEDRQHDNLIVLWADEAQRFVTASEEGMSDYNCVDVIREAQATVVAAAQSSTSFIPPLGREKARVFTLNLRNRLIFKAADEEGALESSDFIGKAKVIKKSWGYTGEGCLETTPSRRSTASSLTSCGQWASMSPSSCIASADTVASCCRRWSPTERCPDGSGAVYEAFFDRPWSPPN